MDPESDEARLFLASCGLELCVANGDETPAALDIVQQISSAYVEPVVTVPMKAPNPVEELGRQWHRVAACQRLAADDGRFLILLAGPGASARSWLCVKDSVGRDLPARLLKGNGSLEFIALSIDGKRICATSEEEDEYWVVYEEVSS
ncbi:hypothetical protein ACH4OQ_38235 [Streptomyces luteogriseus]|uniref:hypothetical protein n=1 Tax=Streptomyces luteogriseus TaxID=68233 RepID=UPI0037B3DD01